MQPPSSPIPKLPLRRHPSLMSTQLQASIMQPPSQLPSTHLTKQQLQSLNHRFTDLCSHIQQDQHPSNSKLFFNFISWQAEKQSKSLKFDPQIVSTRLKELENRMEIGRANMELDKRHSPRKIRKRVMQINEESPDYLEIYERGWQREQVFQDMPKDEEEQGAEDQGNQQENQLGITHFGQLRRRPKFLGYLIKRLRSPTPTTKQPPLPLHPQDPTHLNSTQFLAAMKHLDKNRDAPNPQQIIDMQYPKFFNRVNNQNLSHQIREKPICKRLIRLHEHYVEGSPEISDENKRKLQTRLNHIVREIAKVDRQENREKIGGTGRGEKSRSKSKSKLPRLT